LDKWLEIDRSLDELSVETNITAYQVVSKRCYAGAAGTILSNLSSLEIGKLYAIGFIGDDGEGFELQRILTHLKVNIDSLFISKEIMTPTYTKPVFIKQNKLEEINRLDHKNINPTSKEMEQQIIDSLWKIIPQIDALIVLDQLAEEGHGVITPRIRNELSVIGEKFPELIIFVDSRRFIKHFQNVIIKCNNLEAVKIFDPAAKPELDEVKDCLKRLCKLCKREVFISCGPEGILTLDNNGFPVMIPAVPLDPNTEIDIVGAGDACSSGIVSSLCCNASPEDAAFVGNLVASDTIQVIGTTGTTTRGNILAAFDKYYGQ
jgi:bifunctional ADP-heptose synthase (sugar kinase/adenylyltransferase)